MDSNEEITHEEFVKYMRGRGYHWDLPNKTKNIDMSKEKISEYREKIKNLQEQMNEYSMLIMAENNLLIAEFCPHKIGDKVSIKYGKMGGNKVVEAYCSEIKFYRFSYPMKFIYKFVRDMEQKYFTCEYWAHMGKITWLP